ncbi:MAG: 50S ribosomal protein L25 [Gemmataceae bacterium]|nr:50S ribosomal protein L25 [Gemmataceae bacterium]
MAEAVVLSAQQRNEQGTHNARRLRKGGKIPAVLYGHKEATVPLTLSRDELYKAVRQGVRLVDVQQGDKSEKALIRDVQWDPLGHDILHVDFARVSMDERIEVDVRVELRGTAPGVVAGGVLNQPLHTLKIECLAISIPESIRVSIAELQIDQAIQVASLTLPEGVKVLNDPDAIIVQCAPKVVEEAVAVPGAAPTAEQAEPEVIGRQKAEEGEDEADEKKK